MNEQIDQQVQFPAVDQAIEKYLEQSKRIGCKVTVLKDEIKTQHTYVMRHVCIATDYSLQVFRQRWYDNGLYLDLEQETIWLDEAELFMTFLKGNSP